ncbi:unnamed protein product [Caenorhabditis angaria]|uniref:RRM domain-containing protein n=1 Tax=Caenorhabditis angaria TaxID=860376 RepID=A0A9P1MVD1_9PELO|nr:unnamed protein product [Caenorhabditis angaria]
MSDARIYIGRISSRVSERDVEHFFRGYGQIRDILLKNGFGFVEFDDKRDAEDAVYDLNGKELNGERVILDYSKPRGGGTGGRGGGRAGAYGGRYERPRREGTSSRYGRPYSTRHRLVVENLSSRISWQDLKDQIRKHGIEPTYAEAHKRPNEALMCFASSSDLRKCIDKCDGMELNGRKIKLVDDSSSARSRSNSRSRSPPTRRRSRSASRSRSPQERRKRDKKSRSRSNSRSRSRSGERSMFRKSSPKASRSRSRSPSRSPSPKRESQRSASNSPRDDGDN